MWVPVKRRVPPACLPSTPGAAGGGEALPGHCEVSYGLLQRSFTKGRACLALAFLLGSALFHLLPATAPYPEAVVLSQEATYGSPNVLCSQCLRGSNDLSQRLLSTYARHFKCITYLILQQAHGVGGMIALIKYNQGSVK